MALSGTDTETSSDSFNGDFSDFEEVYEDLVESESQQTGKAEQVQHDDVEEGAYEDEPIASEEWMDDYTKRQTEIQELESNLTK